MVLFDEIEKAHPQILDKFVQILDDGRLTDRRGITASFSDCLLIFTSNLGVLETDPQTGHLNLLITPGNHYFELETRVREAIRNHFTKALGRPGLLDRIGDNIVVFDFITAEVARQILDLQLRNVADRLAVESGIRLELGNAALQRLDAWCDSDVLAFGGRGIGNMIEARLINPLARYLFDANAQTGRVTVDDLQIDRGQVTLIARHEP